ncbi:MAG: Ni/Fe-hydrogenase cytochrome b subunit [Acidobacteriota bacterium]|nr:Ni/Fe-hydrogenase cytochrome b subunit [Acidobacteriota bacterium]
MKIFNMNIKVTFWRILFVIIMVLGIYSTYVRYLKGLGAVSAMTDQFPWGLWIAFDCLCGIMLAGGAFCITGAVYIFHVERLHSIVKPTVLTAFLGYVLFIVGLLFDLGRPWYIWHMIIYQNLHSVMFEVGMCVMTYTTVLFLEFLPNVLERFHINWAIKVVKFIYPVLIVLGILLSTLHQSSLGSLFLIVPEKMHPFWATPATPFFFFLSAIACGIAMTIFESTISSRAFGRGLERSVLVELGGALYIIVMVIALLRLQDYVHRGVFMSIFHPSYEAYFLWAELVLCFVIPLVMLSFKKVRTNPNLLYIAALSTILGFVTNRVNVALTSMEAWVGYHYMPKWTEVSITIMICAMGFFCFSLAVNYLPIFEEEHKHASAPLDPAARIGDVPQPELVH